MTVAWRSRSFRRGVAVAGLGLLAGVAIGIEWIRSRPAPPTPSGDIDLVGAGATFPYPLYRRWFAEYGAASGVRINYHSVGSAEGIRLVLDGTVDFGASDRPMSPEERTRATCGPFELPTVAGAVAVAYQLPGLAAALRFDADALASIFLGAITHWDDPALRALNPGVALPARPILVVRRARTTGTSALFAEYLAESPQWQAALRDGRTDALPAAQVEGNEGVAAEIRAREGALGVVEYTYAQQARLPVAALRNKAGAFVSPGRTAITRAVEERLTAVSADTALGAVGATAPDAYPAVALTRIAADAALGDPTRGAHFVAFARWALRDGARIAAELGYAPLPDAVARRQLRRLDALRPGTCPSLRR